MTLLTTIDTIDGVASHAKGIALKIWRLSLGNTGRACSGNMFVVPFEMCKLTIDICNGILDIRGCDSR